MTLHALDQWLKKEKYTSHEVQNEMLKVMAESFEGEFSNPALY